MKRSAKTLSVILSLAVFLLCVPFYSFAQEGTVPKEFDPRQDAKVTPVRQTPDKYDLCWAYATVGALEQSLIFSGLDNASVDLSEKQLAWFSSMSEKKTFEPAERFTTNYITAPIFAMSRLNGLADEAQEPMMPDKPYIEPVSYSKDSVSDYELVSAIKVSGNIEEIKKNIMEYGGGCVCYHNDEKTFSSDHKSYYQNDSQTVNHSVTVIGWNDGYSRDNFTVKPDKDGAWLVKSVWGTRHEDGYYWISYCEKELTDFYFYKLRNASLDNVYTHNAGMDKVYASSENSVQAANVFKAKQDETLKEISFFVEGSEGKGTDYSVRIFKELKEGSPVDGIMCAQQEGSVSFDGYYTVKMPDDIKLSEGERFSVIVALKAANGHHYFLAEDAGCKAQKGESYYFSEKTGKWQDCTQTTMKNAYINAYTVNDSKPDKTKLEQLVKEHEDNAALAREIALAKSVLELNDPESTLLAKVESQLEAAANRSCYTVISNADDWNVFAKSVCSGSRYSNKIVVLSEDIDFKDKEFVCAGDLKDNSFEGIFDGCGHSISNITSDSCGLFGTVGKYGCVRDLSLCNCTFTSDNAGGVAGKCTGASIIGCGFSGKLGGGSCGGIIGQAECSTLSDCWWDCEGIESAAGSFADREKSCVHNCFAADQSENDIIKRAQKLAETLNTNDGKNKEFKRFEANEGVVKAVVHGIGQNNENSSKTASHYGFIIMLIVLGTVIAVSGVMLEAKAAKKRREKQTYPENESKNGER